MEKCEFLLNSNMQSILKYARDKFIPVLLDDTANELYKELKKYEPKRVLEIGTAIGYSGTLILNSCNCQLYTLEKDEDSFKIALKHFEEFDLSNRITAKLCDAKDELNLLVQNNEKFDFIFLDGPKGQYINYLPLLKQLLVSGGVLFADNVYYKGFVLSTDLIPHKKRTIVVNLRKFIESIKQDPEFINVRICKIGDGITIAEKL